MIGHLYTARKAALAGLMLGLLWMPGASGQVINVIYTDSSNFGFNDRAIRVKVPGNSGVTLGQQRREAFEAAIEIWASRLDSNIAVRLQAEFDDLGCGERTTLGQAGSLGLARNFLNAPEREINFPYSLAASLRGMLFDNTDAEMRATFNFRIDQGNCAQSVDSFWYGLDPDVPPPLGSASFLELALHEIGHALGFQSLTDREDFEFIFDRPDRMSRFIFSTALNRSWREMTAAERETSSTSGNNLVFTGEQTNLRAAERLLPPSRVRIESSGSNFPAFIQGFQPYLALEGLTAGLVLADSPGPGPGPGDPWHRALACEPLSNTSQVAGNIVLIKRGECFFAQKWQNAFDAGAAGVLIADNVSAGTDGSIARDGSMSLDRNLPIPIWSVSLAVGDQIRSAMPIQSFSMGYQLSAPARGTRQGFTNLQASTENTGSNVSHFSTTMFPRSVMNPSISNVAFDGNLDFTPELLADLGWMTEASKVNQYSGNWFNVDRSGEGCQLTLEQGESVPVLTCYFYDQGEQFWLIGAGEFHGDRFEFNEMIITEGADFGSGFDEDDVIKRPWGRIRMDITDCNRARFEIMPEVPGLLPLTSRMQKIVPGDCNRRAIQQPNRARSGNYFSVGRDGEGLQLAREATGSAWVLTFYTYLEGKQVWMIGTGALQGNRIEFDEMIITRGGVFGPGFDPDAIERILFGSITVDFDGCNDLQVSIDPVLAEFEPGQRSMTRIVPRQC
jgi:hypothetical protein